MTYTPPDLIVSFMKISASIYINILFMIILLIELQIENIL
jgi:hypothetical protein